MWKSTLILATLLATTFALNLPGVPTDFTANDAVLSAVSGELRTIGKRIRNETKWKKEIIKKRSVKKDSD